MGKLEPKCFDVHAETFLGFLRATKMTAEEQIIQKHYAVDQASASVFSRSCNSLSCFPLIPGKCPWIHSPTQSTANRSIYYMF